MMYNSCGTNYELDFRKAKYIDNGRLAIQVLCREESEDWYEPFCMLTVNLPDVILSSDGSKDMPSNMAFLNINNYGTDDLYKKLIDMGYMTMTRTVAQSGFCSYPLVKFDEEWLASLPTA